MKNKEQKKALEKLVKDNFCGKASIISCPYEEKDWCPHTCGYYLNKIQKAKYWTR